MSRIRIIIAAALVAAALAPTGASSAQRVDAARSVSLAARTVLAVQPDSDAARYAVHMTPVAPARPAARAADEGGRSTVGQALRTIVGVGTGAVVGGWLGYFGAQVGRSDWDQATSSQKNSVRQGYTAAGIGVGSVLGYFLRPKVRVRGALPQPINIPQRTGRQLFAATELRRSIATNALEAVEMDRPEWTKPQRDDEARAGAAARTGPVETISLVVYVGDERVGGIETLRDIAIPEVAELRFYDARDARRRWGQEHRYGAIEVVPANSASAASASVPPVPAADSTK
jgi:hypothetical protein